MGFDPTLKTLDRVRDNRAATTAPTASDDVTQGYSPGSMWVDISAGQVYWCADASAGAAVWRQVGVGGTGGISQVLGGRLLNGDKTTTSTAFVAVPGTTLAAFTPSAGEWVLVSVAGTFDNSVGSGSRYGFDVAHDNSGSWARVSGAARGTVYEEPDSTDEVIFSFVTAVQLPNAVPTQFRMEYVVSAGGGSVTIFASTGRVPCTFQVVRF